jgi:hypothetical protein
MTALSLAKVYFIDGWVLDPEGKNLVRHEKFSLSLPSKGQRLSGFHGILGINVKRMCVR